MSDQREIELDLDDVFPPPGSHSLVLSKPPPRPARRTLPPPPPLPRGTGSMERIQEDVDLIIEATAKRLDEMERSQEEFERTIRGVSGAQERRVREVEDRLERTQRMMLEMTRKLREVLELLDDHQHGIDEMRARNTIAVAKIEQLQMSSQHVLLESDMRRWRDESEPAHETAVAHDSEPTMRVVRR